jgi:rhamnosyl/mannosyltransferase
VDWLGHVEPDRLVGAYRAATALWFPSNARSEGFGLVQVEAMASGCPVINTSVPHSGVSWVSRDGESGLTIPVGDSEALAAASRRFLDEPELRDQLCSVAVARARCEFDDGVMARRSLELYAQAIDGASRRTTAGRRRGTRAPDLEVAG